MVPILCPPVLLSCMHLSTSYSTWNLNLMAGLIPSHFLISGDDSSFHREGPFSRHLFMLKTILLFPSLLIPIHSHFQIICFFCLCGWISEFYLSIPSTPTHGASISSAWLLSWPISGLGSPKFPWGSALVLGGKKKELWSETTSASSATFLKTNSAFYIWANRSYHNANAWTLWASVRYRTAKPALYRTLSMQYLNPITRWAFIFFFPLHTLVECIRAFSQSIIHTRNPGWDSLWAGGGSKGQGWRDINKWSSPKEKSVKDVERVREATECLLCSLQGGAGLWSLQGCFIVQRGAPGFH